MNFIGQMKIFLVSLGISWPFLFGVVTGTTQFGFKMSSIETPVTYISISIISVVIGIIAVLIERKRMEEKIFETFKTFSNYVRACREIHQIRSRIIVLAKTPGLILPTERDLHPDRKEYFDYIHQRLQEGKSSYQLDYVFDTDGYKSIIAEYILKNDQKQIEEARNMLKKIIMFDNLDLRVSKTDTLASAIIGGDDIACIGFREKEARKVAEGVRIHTGDLVRVLKSQYDLLFSKATKVDMSFFEEVISSVKGKEGL